MSSRPPSHDPVDADVRGRGLAEQRRRRRARATGRACGRRRAGSRRQPSGLVDDGPSGARRSPRAGRRPRRSPSRPARRPGARRARERPGEPRSRCPPGDEVQHRGVGGVGSLRVVQVAGTLQPVQLGARDARRPAPRRSPARRAGPRCRATPGWAPRSPGAGRRCRRPASPPIVVARPRDAGAAARRRAGPRRRARGWALGEPRRVQRAPRFGLRARDPGAPAPCGFRHSAYRPGSGVRTRRGGPARAPGPPCHRTTGRRRAPARRRARRAPRSCPPRRSPSCTARVVRPSRRCHGSRRRSTRSAEARCGMFRRQPGMSPPSALEQDDGRGVRSPVDLVGERAAVGPSQARHLGLGQAVAALVAERSRAAICCSVLSAIDGCSCISPRNTHSVRPRSLTSVFGRHGGGTRAAVQQRDLAEEVPGPERRLLPAADRDLGRRRPRSRTARRRVRPRAR